MALRFQKRIKIAPGLRVNLSKRGAGLSVGLRGASVTTGQQGTQVNIGAPGTGLSTRKRLSKKGGHLSWGGASIATLAVIAVFALAKCAMAMTDGEAYSAAEAIGTIIASEGPCHISLDQDAIRAWVNTTVPADRLDYPSMMSGAVALAGYRLKDMGQSEMTAHCTAITNSAKALGLTH